MKRYLSYSVIGLRGLIAACVLALTIWFASFDDYRPPTIGEIRNVPAAVVFTGQFERIDIALQMLDQGTIRRLFISGLNPGAGLFPTSFVAQFSARNPNIERLAGLTDCCIRWGDEADTTIQNADETKCWLTSESAQSPLLLISGRQHLARALAALRAAGVSNQILPYPVEEAGHPENELRRRALEFTKLLGQTLLSFTPWYNANVALHGRFAGGCPHRK